MKTFIVQIPTNDVPIGPAHKWIHIQVDGQTVISFRASGTLIFDHYGYVVNTVTEAEGAVDVSLSRKPRAS